MLSFDPSWEASLTSHSEKRGRESRVARREDAGRRLRSVLPLARPSSARADAARFDSPRLGAAAFFLRVFFLRFGSISHYPSDERRDFSPARLPP